MRHKIFFFVILVLIGISTASILYKYQFRKLNGDIILSENQKIYKRKPLDPGGIIIPYANSLIYEKLNPDNSLSVKNIKFSEEPEEPLELPFKSNLEDIIVSDSIDTILAELNLDEAPKITDELSDYDKLPQQFTIDEKDTENLGNKRDKVHKERRKNPNTESSSKFSAIVDSSKKSSDIDIERFTAQDRGKDKNNKLKVTNLLAKNNKLEKLNLTQLNFSYKIQLSSAWSEKEAKAKWKKIQSRHRKYLKNTKLSIKKVKISNNKIIYLIMAGNYSSLNKAKLICKKLILGNQHCIVTKQ